MTGLYVPRSVHVFSVTCMQKKSGRPGQFHDVIITHSMYVAATYSRGVCGVHRVAYNLFITGKVFVQGEREESPLQTCQCPPPSSNQQIDVY